MQIHIHMERGRLFCVVEIGMLEFLFIFFSYDEWKFMSVVDYITYQLIFGDFISLSHHCLV